MRTHAHTPKIASANRRGVRNAQISHVLFIDLVYIVWRVRRRLFAANMRYPTPPARHRNVFCHPS